MSIDVAEFAARSRPVEWDDLDLEAAFADRPLSAEALRCIRYMHDIESHTVCYLRDLLLTESHRDPRITTFLTTWAWEEQWHGVALAAVLAAHGETAGRRPDRRNAERARPEGPARSAAHHRWAVVLARRDFVAVHMTWGALNEWSTQAGYARLAELEHHPVLTELLERIQRQEARHIAFYATEARERLAASPRARRLVRLRPRQAVGAGRQRRRAEGGDRLPRAAPALRSGRRRMGRAALTSGSSGCPAWRAWGWCPARSAGGPWCPRLSRPSSR